MLENQPELWRGHLPVPKPDGHKYDRGHVLIFGATELTGATRLAAEACSRIGAGLVTVLADQKSDLYRACLAPDIMVVEHLPRRLPNILLAGPGGLTSSQILALKQLADHDMTWLLDAAGLELHEFAPKGPRRSVLTPHTGEFTRTFPNYTGHRAARAASAATETGHVIVLKGAETLIAEPGGERIINRHATPYLAKAGTGDVLAGIIAGLLAQGMDSFAASCAGVWIHGEAGRQLGPGMIASDLADRIPLILRDLL